MAKYSLELRDIYNDKSYNLFDFDYPFYDEALRTHFQEKFFQWYMFDEIGFPTIGYFKQRLKAKLNLIMPYYVKLYATEVASKDVNFILNKDLKETFIRDITSNANSTANSNIEGTSNNSSLGNTTSTNSGNNSTDNTNIVSDTPEGQITDIETYMSSASKDNNVVTFEDENNGNFTNSSTGDFNNVATNTNESLNTGRETTELISQGNIGITSSGQLLEDWRKVLINIDEMILNDLNSLFMQIY